MKNKKLITQIFLKAGKAVRGFHDKSSFSDMDVLSLAKLYEQRCADAILFFDLSDDKWEHAEHVEMIRRIHSNVDIPLVCGGNIETAENVEKLLHAGCSKVVLNMSKQSNVEMLNSLSERYGKEHLAVCINGFAGIREMEDKLKETASVVFLLGDNRHLYDAVNSLSLPTIPVISMLNYEHILALLRHENVIGISGNAVSNLDLDMGQLRYEVSLRGVNMHSCEYNFEWQDLKLNSDGMIPVVVQDYKTQDVLMMAYMNQQSFEHTLLTGRMTYYSRSRQQLWVKGETSGHFQYVKQILIDCDNDTLLAKVSQVGAACHTGNRTCFYRELVPPKYNERNTAMVLDNIMDIIRNHRENPEDNSYTNHLFDQGLNQILKRIGETSLGLIFASKGENNTEIEQEACNLLYHLMVLMVQLGISWEDITNELSKR